MARIEVKFGAGTSEVAVKGTPAANASLPFKERLVAKPAASVEIIQILLDASGSMADKFPTGTQKMMAAKRAVRFFLGKSSPHKSWIGLTAFGLQNDYNDKGIKMLVSPTTIFDLVQSAAESLDPWGGTPLKEALHKTIVELPGMHRTIVVSDGIPMVPDQCLKEAEIYKEHGKPIDAIYIGTKDDEGMEFMKQLAEMTGGIFAFADDLRAFEQAFAQLETEARLQLEHKA